MASADRIVCMGLLASLSLGALVGCDSTQDKNARAQLQAERLLAARAPQQVERANPHVDVESVAVVRGDKSAAIVVELRNRSDRPLTDLPIAVGIRTAGGKRVLLNARRNLGWFQTHVPAVAADGRTTWVFKGRGDVPAGRPYARVGIAGPRVVSRATALPELAATVDDTAAATARVVVENTSDVPQFGLQVYALARAGGRYVVAGKAEVEHLGTGGRTTAEVPLTGAPGRRQLQAIAVPTIFD